MKKIVLLAVLLALIVAVSASVKAGPIELCECEQTKDAISISNAGEAAFYSLKIYASGATSGFIENNVFVESRSTAKIPFWLSSCELGESTATLVVESKNELQSIDIPVK